MRYSRNFLVKPSSHDYTLQFFLSVLIIIRVVNVCQCLCIFMQLLFGVLLSMQYTHQTVVGPTSEENCCLSF